MPHIADDANQSADLRLLALLARMNELERRPELHVWPDSERAGRLALAREIVAHERDAEP